MRPLQSLVVSLLLSLVNTLLFSRIRGLLSHRNSLTQILSISTEELVLPRQRCNGHSLLLSSYLFRIGRIENPSCSDCGQPSKDTSHLILHCPATDSLRCSLFGDSLSLFTTSGPGLGHAPIPRKGSDNNNNKGTIPDKNCTTTTTTNYRNHISNYSQEWATNAVLPFRSTI